MSLRGLRQIDPAYIPESERKSQSFQRYLIGSLKDLKEAEGYLKSAIEEGDVKVSMLAKKNVTKALGELNTLKILQKINKAMRGE